MCMTCGCGKPNEAHGDDRHITRDDLKSAADAAGISEQDAANNLMDAFQKA